MISRSGPVPGTVRRRRASMPLTIHLSRPRQRGGPDAARASASWECKRGLSLNPGTPLTRHRCRILPDLDLVLVMSVQPGFGGQSFDHARGLEKIAELDRRRADRGATSYLISVDGGINDRDGGGSAASRGRGHPGFGVVAAGGRGSGRPCAAAAGGVACRRSTGTGTAVGVSFSPLSLPIPFQIVSLPGLHDAARCGRRAGRPLCRVNLL